MKATTALRKQVARIAKWEAAARIAILRCVRIEMQPVASGVTFTRTVTVSLRDDNGKIVRDDNGKVVRVPVKVVCQRTVSQDWKAATRTRRTAQRKLRKAEARFALMAATMPPADVVSVLRGK